MPAGSRVFEVNTSGDNAIKAIAVEKDGKYMIAAVNVSKSDKQVRIESSSLNSLNGTKQFIYAEGVLVTEGDHSVKPNKTDLNLDLREGLEVRMPAESLVIYTSFEY